MTTEMKLLIALIAAILLAGSFSLGVMYGKHTAKFSYHEISDRARSEWIIIPEGWTGIPVLDKHGRIYKRPSDEEG